jgi:DNA-binding response OmpR family regulator
MGITGMTPPTTILIIEDDPAVAEALVEKLSAANFNVIAKATGAEGLASFRADDPDLIVLDLMLPDMDGLDVFRRIRELETNQRPWASRTGVVILTAKAEESDRVVGLEIGADDYVAKPFSPKELLARVKAVLRRTAGRTAAPEEAVIRVAGLELDTARHRIVLRPDLEGEGKLVDLTAIEYNILATLMRHAGTLVTKSRLLEAVWGYEGFSPNLLQIHISHIRAKIEDNPRQPRRLLTVRSFGYRIAAH